MNDNVQATLVASNHRKRQLKSPVPVLFYSFLILLSAMITSCNAQTTYEKPDPVFSKGDTLRGMLGPERTCYDVTFYDLNVEVFPEKEYIKGSNTIHFDAKSDFSRLQIDLFKNMKINRIEFEGKNLGFDRQYNAVFIDLPKQTKGTKGKFEVFYEGRPIVAQQPPWDGGFIWSEDKNDNPWIAVACEGIGASLWWPNKDHLSDEPDSMRIACTVPENLVCVSNGNLREVEMLGEKRNRFNWFVSYPINNYNVSLNIGDYANIKDIYTAEDGDELALDYYVLNHNKEKARKYFKNRVPEMLSCFEQYLGKYPFWNDGYALIETPYLGMEHQSGIAYGNNYQDGYAGMTTAGLDFDYLLVHESGHEYFGNSISCKDHAEMWLHEGFTVYMDALFVECKFGYESALDYYTAQRRSIRNADPIVGLMDVNYQYWEGSDMYFKGAWILHTLRNIIDDDELWFKTFRSFYEKHQLSHITTEDFIRHINEATGKNFTAFFEQYLHHARIPKLEYKLKKKGKNLLVLYRMNTQVENLSMPIEIGKKGKYTKVTPTSKWQKIKLKKIKPNEFKIALELYYIHAKELK